jgi:hypothetical protein
MPFFKKYYAKFFFKQFSIGIVEDDLETVIKNKRNIKSVKWLKTDHFSKSFADPFIFVKANGKINILAEKFTTGKLDGKICLINYDNLNGFSSPQILLEDDRHFSYPFIYVEGDKMFVILTELKGSVLLYEYDEIKQKLFNEKVICDMPLLDATFIKANNRFWVFGSLHNSDNLHIYYADNLAGPYKPHTRNPVKNNLNGSRPAGNFITINGDIYIPLQNCSNYYGESITINKIIKLTPDEFEYEDYMTIKADKNDEYNFGIHTINAAGNFIVVDGQKGHFQPFLQIIRAIKRMFSNINTI